MLHNTSYIICHYAEIGIKGGNRNYFERILAKNIKEKLDKELPDSFEHIKRISGRILVKLSSSEKQIKNSLNTYYLILTTTFGIANFSFAIESKQDIKILKKDCWDLIRNKKFKTFRITAQRSQKDFPMTSEEINKEVGAYVVEKSKKKVNLTKPDVNCFIEIVDRRAFIYLEKIKGPGGMPVGSNGKALILLSGGIDSPVAAYYALKRGVKADFIHFHSMPYTTPASVEKVKNLAKILGKFQIQSKIFLVPFADIQKEIVLKTPEKLRIIIYRRLMLRIAEKLAQDNKYLALYTGESVGQVASQTLENINATEDAINLPILRPLIGFDKEDIIKKAKQIGTYEISILPHEDCCARFVPKHPEIKADLKEVQIAEKKLDIEKMIEKAVEKIKIEKG
ncbi:tRNA 4-thiouridine(8) synthase ThiI [bacterium]|nr:tRNA 4-thiouridine(8) synthase ThiI [bacterium]